ncbi:MAG: 30S ribosomal protein S1 [Geobacteraceae bacterium]|nr:30S ribosomal protein S1 [Geobacteraceae bacterium]
MTADGRQQKRNVAPIKRFKDIDDDHELSASGEFAELFQDSLNQPKAGEVVQGTVVQIAQDFVMVDVGYKSEGRVPVEEFMDEDGVVTVQPGDKVYVLFLRNEGSGGLMLSKRKAEQLVGWERVAEAGGEGGTIEGKIVGKVKGGLTVDIGLPAFLPASQVDIRPGGNLDRYIGQTTSFRILKLNRKRGNVVLSRRVILEEDRGQVREQTLSSIEEGQIRDGIVKNLTDYGAFVDVGGVDGLLHVTDMSWGKLGHPSELIKVGDSIKVKVLKYDSAKGKISLGIKQTIPDPWIEVESKFSVGERVSGRVVSLMEYGAFVALSDGIEGLIHVSEMSWTKRVRHPSEILKAGDTVETVILGIDTGNRRISLGLKQTQENPWLELEDRYPSGTKLEGQIKNITDFGAFIGVEDGIDGLVHVSDISWTKRIKHPGEVFTKGQTVQAVVLSIDPANERLSLGVKQLHPDPWTIVPDKYRPGTRIKGKVTSVTDFGVFMEIEDGIEGLVHVSELSQEKVQSAKEFTTVGTEFEAVVLNVDTQDRKIALSLKALQAAIEKEEIQGYMGGQNESFSSLGELFKTEMNKNNN